MLVGNNQSTYILLDNKGIPSELKICKNYIKHKRQLSEELARENSII
jgi:hypothetical protein